MTVAMQLDSFVRSERIWPRAAERGSRWNMTEGLETDLQDRPEMVACQRHAEQRSLSYLPKPAASVRAGSFGTRNSERRPGFAFRVPRSAFPVPRSEASGSDRFFRQSDLCSASRGTVSVKRAAPELLSLSVKPRTTPHFSSKRKLWAMASKVGSYRASWLASVVKVRV